MTMHAVEWVLVVHYGPEAHRATYGRQVKSNRYTKDYIQLSRKEEFLNTVAELFAINPLENSSVPLTYQWSTGQAAGDFVFKSSDRPHLKWGTSTGAPPVWKMSTEPSESSAFTIPGDPSCLNFEAAEYQFKQIAAQGAGQPYLMAVKLREQPRTLHLRVYLTNPSDEFSWADIKLAPKPIQDLAKQTSQHRALSWSVFQSGGIAPNKSVQDAVVKLSASGYSSNIIDDLGESLGRAVASYLKQPGYGIFFDSLRNHDAWLEPSPLPPKITASINELLELLETRYPEPESGDAVAESSEVSAEELFVFQKRLESGDFEVSDSHATAKTRGSAQRVFAKKVKTNYNYQCAITGIKASDYLIASHIVPWSIDQTIRLDPSNGICLSLLVDRAFEKGYLVIKDDFTILINFEKIGNDESLRRLLEPYNGKKLNAPAVDPPNVSYLQRRREITRVTN